jgi:polysaccharide deacetylase 2 family uncharacterized protein YibQ
LIVMAALAGVAAWVGYERGKQEGEKVMASRLEDCRGDLARLREKMARNELPKKPRNFVPSHRPLPPEPTSPKNPTPPSKPKEKKASRTTDYSEVRDFLASGGKKSEPAKRPAPSGKKPAHGPWLAIVIDDVAYASQVRAIRALPWPVTPSLFPPTPRHADTPAIAKGLRHYMVHLPMEALHFNKPEEETLTVGSTEAQIDRRLRQIREWFPKARFINNHTGSRFTADKLSMERFCRAARRYGFLFLDSRTTPKSVVASICKKYKEPYLARNVFLDNHPDQAYIRGQLKKAVAYAKRNGYAIAIGHPHTTTLKALAASKDILKGVKLLYIDELYEKIRGR